MRHILFVLPVVALAGCISPAPQTNEAMPLQVEAFDVPMDPGLIRCSSLSNPIALSAASDWALGQARAAALAGRLSAVPDTANIMTGLSTYCAANSGSTVRAAAAQLGI